MIREKQNSTYIMKLKDFFWTEGDDGEAVGIMNVKSFRKKKSLNEAVVPSFPQCDP